MRYKNATFNGIFLMNQKLKSMSNRLFTNKNLLKQTNSENTIVSERFMFIQQIWKCDLKGYNSIFNI